MFLPLDDRPHILPCAAAPYLFMALAVDESSSSPLQIRAEHLADSERPFLPAECCLFTLFSARLTAVVIGVHEIGLEVFPGGRLNGRTIHIRVALSA